MHCLHHMPLSKTVQQIGIPNSNDPRILELLGARPASDH